ncbi:MAG: hypothetical protein R3C10_22730 [Pirellulales bacterium]
MAEVGMGQSAGQAPVRYLGRFFYVAAPLDVTVPAGATRIEVWKGFEYRPETVTVDLPAGARATSKCC